MEILQLIDQLEHVLNQGWRVPFTSSLVINEEECLRLIDQLRISVPSAIKESERMIAERDRIMSEAHGRAEATVGQAEAEAQRMINQNYVVQEARLEAERIVDMGQKEALRLVQEAEDYALNVLRELVQQLGSSVRQAENGILAIEESRAEAERVQAPNPSKPSAVASHSAPTTPAKVVEPPKPKAANLGDAKGEELPG